jgi:hypothetical protein
VEVALLLPKEISGRIQHVFRRRGVKSSGKVLYDAEASTGFGVRPFIAAFPNTFLSFAISTQTPLSAEGKWEKKMGKEIGESGDEWPHSKGHRSKWGKEQRGKRQ